MAPPPPTKRYDLNKNARPIHAVTHYGNTQALVLDFYRDSRGELRQYSTDPVAYSELLAGRGNPTWMKEKVKRLKKHTKMLEKNDYSAKRPAGPIPAWVLFKNYLPYRKLYNERKGTPFIPTKGRKVGFMDLPAELRNRIYRDWAVKDEPLELLPKSSKHTRGWCENAYVGARKFCGRLKALKLLRLSRQINTELSSIFYGENIFSFTGEVGWTWLRGFMEKIGKRNAASLRHVRVHVFWPGYESERSDFIEPHHLKGIQRYIDAGKRHANLDKARSTPEAFRECIQLFEQYGTLASLTLVLPRAFIPAHIWGLDLDMTKFRDGPVSIGLIHLYSSHELGSYLDGDDRSLRKVKRTKVRMVGKGEARKAVIDVEEVEEIEGPKAFAESQGWEYQIAHYDKKGRYTFA